MPRASKSSDGSCEICGEHFANVAKHYPTCAKKRADAERDKQQSDLFRQMDEIRRMFPTGAFTATNQTFYGVMNLIM